MGSPRRLLALPLVAFRRRPAPGSHGSHRQGRCFSGLDLRELTFHHRAQLRQVRPARANETLDLVLEPACLGADALDVLLDLGARFAHQQLRFAVSLLADLGAELLRGHERVVERLVALTERAELLDEALRLLIEFLICPREPLDLGRHLIAKLVDARLVVSAQGGAEIVPANVDRCEVKRFVANACRAPNRTVPSLTIVAPSSTAIS